MHTLDKLSVFGRRAGGDWIIVYNAKEIYDSNTSSHWEYQLHWTGQKWQEKSGPNAHVFSYRKHADEYIAKYGPSIIAKLPRIPDDG